MTVAKCSSSVRSARVAVLWSERAIPVCPINVFQAERSQEEQSGVEADRFEEQVHFYQRHRGVIETIDSVLPGALVKVNGHYFIVAVPTKVLRIGGIEQSGVSSDSPLFKAMEGLHAGDEFEWNNQTLVLKEIR
jgi:hypothetical protein